MLVCVCVDGGTRFGSYVSFIDWQSEADGAATKIHRCSGGEEKLSVSVRQRICAVE